MLSNFGLQYQLQKPWTNKNSRNLSTRHEKTPSEWLVRVDQVTPKTVHIIDTALASFSGLKTGVFC